MKIWKKTKHFPLNNIQAQQIWWETPLYSYIPTFNNRVHSFDGV
jgi:hypothetical protein